MRFLIINQAVKSVDDTGISLKNGETLRWSGISCLIAQGWHEPTELQSLEQAEGKGEIVGYGERSLRFSVDYRSWKAAYFVREYQVDKGKSLSVIAKCPAGAHMQDREFYHAADYAARYTKITQEFGKAAVFMVMELP